MAGTNFLKQNRSFLYFLILIFSGILFYSCAHDPVFPEGPSGVIIPPNPRDSTGVLAGKTCDPDTVYFQNAVMPILLSSCAYAGCHDSKSRKEGVILDTYANVVRTGRVVAFKPGSSKLYTILLNGAEDRMPPSQIFPSDNIATIAKWINQGALNNVCNACNPDLFTLSEAVVPILENYCVSCHNATRHESGVNLVGYDNIKLVAESGALVGTITQASSYPLMPQGASLPECEISQITLWVTNGIQNN